jgi:hypothetical protein
MSAIGRIARIEPPAMQRHSWTHENSQTSRRSCEIIQRFNMTVSIIQQLMPCKTERSRVISQLRSDVCATGGERGS